MQFNIKNKTIQNNMAQEYNVNCTQEYVWKHPEVW